MGTYNSNLNPSIYFEELTETLPKLTEKTIAITGTTSGTGLVVAELVALWAPRHNVKPTI